MGPAVQHLQLEDQPHQLDAARRRRARLQFAAYTLGAHSYVKIHTGHGTRTQTDRYWNQNWYIWNNTGDTATLRDSSGGTVDSCRYTGTSAGYVFC